jgi:hypothetical protein
MRKGWQVVFLVDWKGLHQVVGVAEVDGIGLAFVLRCIASSSAIPLFLL